MDIFHQVIGDALTQADPDSMCFSRPLGIERWLILVLVEFELLGSFRRGQAFSLSVELAIWHSYVLASYYGTIGS